jgi:hypothetical protein
MKRFITAAIVLVFALGLLGGCGLNSAAERRFTKEGFSITLTENFAEESADGYIVAYSSDRDRVVVMAQREDFALFREIGLSTNISLREYAQIAIDANGVNSHVEEREGVVFFTYDNNGYSYFATVHRAPDAYWLVQFSCLTGDFDKRFDNFVAWAKTIEVEQTNMSIIGDIVSDIVTDLNRPQAMNFSKSGFTITLDDSFEEIEADGFTAAYISDEHMTMVMVLKEDFAIFQAAGIPTDISLAEYAQITIDANGVSSRIIERDGLVYFTYESGNNSYLAVVYRGADAYWLINFATFTEEFDGLLRDFINWAKGVNIAQGAGAPPAINDTVDAAPLTRVVTLGQFNIYNGDNPDVQKGWVTDGLGFDSNLTLRNFTDARYLIVEFDREPAGNIDFIWSYIGSEGHFGWNQTNMGSASSGAFTLTDRTLTIDLTKMNGYNDFANTTNSDLVIFLGYYSNSWYDLPITDAYFAN